jgi:hypothetical protein
MLARRRGERALGGGPAVGVSADSVLVAFMRSQALKLSFAVDNI